MCRAERYDTGPSKGRKRALVFGTSGPQGGISADPGVAFAYYIRRQLRPIRVSPAIIYDAKGHRIGEIRVDSVTGKRTRVADALAPPTSTIPPLSVSSAGTYRRLR